jgi:CPA1 family monovalent cation:H+ antiporter
MFRDPHAFGGLPIVIGNRQNAPVGRLKQVEVFALLMVAVIGVVLAGRRLNVPYPIALVIGGLCISLVPGLPVIHVDPEVVFLVFLPPLLYAAAWMTSWHEFKSNLRPIFQLAVGLVLFTTITLGFAIHALIPSLPLAVAFAFGAIVSPPDAVAATAIAQQVRLPKRIITIIEGESLVNDATGLVALQFAVVAAASGTFSLGHATLEFAWLVTGGIGLGLVVGVAVAQIMRCIEEDSLVITMTLLAPYFAYLPAERLHVSGVLAVVTAGVYGGWRGPELLAASARLSGVAVWTMLVFVLNCVLFIVIGLQLPQVVHEQTNYSTGQLIWYGAIASGLVILIRPLWVFPGAWLPRKLSKTLRERDPLPPWQHITVIAWSGMRGVVSLAAALALPMVFENGQPFPGRGLVIFLTFCVILSTLVFQGLTLPWLIRLLGIKERKSDDMERNARLRIARAGLARITELAQDPKSNDAAVQRLTNIYQERVNHYTDDLAATLGWSPDHERLIVMRRLWIEALLAERRELVRLHREHGIDDELMHQIEYEIDLDETRLRRWAV